MKIAFVRLAFLLLVLAFPALQAGAQTDTDVLVYGSTPAGFCAAIAAAREGSSVILIEPTNHVGGVNTGGLSFSDSNQTVRSNGDGLFDEWHARIEKGLPAARRLAALQGQREGSQGVDLRTERRRSHHDADAG